MPYTVEKTDLNEVLLLAPQVFSDSRGFFFESFNEREFEKSTGLNIKFVQDNHSLSAQGVLRGLHFQRHYPQGKLIRVVRGEIFDVAVDIRPESAAYGQWTARILDSAKHHQLWIPAGFAHGFLVLEDDTIFSYKCSNYYSKELERSICWNDAALAINWGCDSPLLSPRDEQAMLFSEFETPFF